MTGKLTYVSLVLALILASAAGAADLVGFWKFDGGTLDSSGLGNEATLAGDPDFVDGWLGQAVFLDGDDYITMDGVADNVTSNDVTMSAWVKTTDHGDWFSVNSGTGGNVALFATDNQRAAMYDGSYQGHSTTIVTDGQWHMLTYVRRGNTGYIYVDGVLENSHAPGFGLSPDDRWSLGQEWDTDTPSDFLVGTVDEARVYNGGLTDAEVMELFNASTSSTAAWRPQPLDGQVDVMTDEQLSWTPGLGAVSHDIYLGTSKADVTSGAAATSQGNQITLSFDPGPLLPATTYYWRIDEKTSDGTVTSGDVWSFTTAEFAVVDGFEDYNDFPPDEIYTTWQDGFQNPENGSQIGYLTVPSVETQIVYSGNQSMPFFYDNSTASSSEAVRTFASPRDFVMNGLTGLTLWFQGQPAAVGSVSFDAASQIYTLTGSGADIGGVSDELHYAFKQLTGGGSVTVKVESLTDTHAWARAGVMIRETLDPDSPHAMVVVTPTGRVAFEFRATAGQDSHSTHTGTGTITGPHWIRLNRSASNVFTGEHSFDGVNWVPVESPDPADPSGWTITMSQSAYVGLVISAHDAEATSEATFSNVGVIGNASPGPFAESRDVGIGSNAPGPLYLRLEDDAGNPGTVFHEDGPDAVLTVDWDLWAIPLEDFQSQGVDIVSVKKITIGVGDKDNPQPGGPGRLFVDDIQLVRRLPATGRVLLFEEDFEALVLGPNVDEGLAGDEVWTKTPPFGWIIDDSGVPGAGDPANDGVAEWAGWSFANKQWWVEAAEDQERSQFVLANGTVALVDPDEWDDLPRAPGLLNSFLSTPQIDVSTTEAGAGAIQLKFDSSWRREDTQTASVVVQFDDGDPVEVLRYESEGADTGFVKDDAVSEAVTVDIDRPAAAKKMVVTFGMLDAGNDWWWAIDNVQISGISRERTIVFAEDFEGLELGASLEESPGTEEAWTDTPPAGWIVEDSGVPGAGDPATDGVTEWAGWSFANKEFWINTDFQRRNEFELGQGTVAVADSDEYDDADHPAGSYDTYLTTPAIDVSGFEADTLQLMFDSSWRPEVIQTANITVQYDGGDPTEVLRWESQAGSNFFKDDNSTNETIIVNLDNPPEAVSAVLTFGYFNTSNNWWWAIDNIEVSALPRERAVVFSEDFEGLPLGPNVDETVVGDEVWTKTAPEGWTLDDSGVPGLDDPADGVTEWAGWSFADNDWWAAVDDQRRSEFELAIGAIAVADSDEYDDKGNPIGTYNAFMSTPPIDISNLEAGTTELMFDSSWRPESSQTANITASYDGGDPIEVMRWESNSSSPFFHDHSTNETATVPLDNPAGAQIVVLTFGYFDAGNNWWWAVDNVLVSGYPKAEAAPVRIFSEKFDSVTLTPSVDEAPPGNFWTKTPPAGWSIDDSRMPGVGDPASDGVTDWAGWSFASKDWWVQVAGDQERSAFDLASGTVAIADPDEWDDAFHAEGTFNSFLDTAPVDISAVDAGTIELKFDSSWRPYAQQTAAVSVSFDGGDWVDVLLYESDSGSANFKADTTSETVTVPLNNPAGATSVVISFGLFTAGNDWWWAIDNLEVTGLAGGSAVALLVEDFEGLPLGPSVEEAPAGNFWTDTPPEGWIVDDSGVPGAGDPANDGVTEWAGWSFVSKSWWVQVAGDQERSLFDQGNAVVAVADPDEWDDLPRAEGLMNAFLSTPVIDVSGMQADTLQLKFDSSWRQEDTQTASITVQFDGGAPIEILRWESAGGDPAFLKPDATNETVTVDLNNPSGAGEMVITFGMLDAGNDWWWAIDNVEVVGFPVP
ncbi:MAG: LamG domain-containing protein [Phycisphaerae bacterium]|nr:LamG domain-containing protein [Phycisphaerae bacterium]